MRGALRRWRRHRASTTAAGGTAAQALPARVHENAAQKRDAPRKVGKETIKSSS